jgi:hypothetical protein
VTDRRLHKLRLMRTCLKLARLCKDVSAISDTITITTRASQLIVSAKGDFASQETIIDQNTNVHNQDPDGLHNQT